MNALSEWLQLMLAEIARKQDESERARDEETRRAAEEDVTSARREPPGARAASINFPRVALTRRSQRH